MRARGKCLAILAVLLASPAAPLEARESRGVPVQERPRPDYDALGIRAGAFLIKPEIWLAYGYDDNIYAVRADPESDFLAVIAPGFDVRSTWSRHALGISGGMERGIYRTESDENYLDAHLVADGRLDVLRESYLTGRLEISRLHEDRGAPDTSAQDREPSVYYRSRAEAVHYHGRGRMSLRTGADVTSYDFRSLEQLDSSIRSQAERDHGIYNVHARLAYELIPDVQPFVAGGYEWRRYEREEAGRDSNGYRIGLGSGFDLGGVTTGRIFGGYMRQRYQEAGREDISSPWYGLALLWNATGLTSLQATVEKSVRETTLEGASGIDAASLGLQLDHELLRNLLVGAFFDFSREDFQGLALKDRYYALGPWVTYLWNRYLSAEFKYIYLRRDSDLPDHEFSRNRFLVSVSGRI